MEPTQHQPWVEVGGGRLWARGRPGMRLVATLPSLGCTRVVTLLAEREGARELGAAVERAGLAWTWLPLDNGRPPPDAVRARLLAGLPAIVDALRAGESVLVHCAAGIHRTGMVTYALLRLLGLPPADAQALLARIRRETFEGMQPHHFALGDAAPNGV
jgi:protein-tyrosine phosphatase